MPNPLNIYRNKVVVAEVEVDPKEQVFRFYAGTLSDYDEHFIVLTNFEILGARPEETSDLIHEVHRLPSIAINKRFIKTIEALVESDTEIEPGMV